MAESARDIIANSLIAQLPSNPDVSLNNNSPNRQLADKKIQLEQADKVMNSIMDLVPVDSPYRPKYYAALYRMGPNAFWEFVGRARKGKFPQHLFRRLIDGPKK